MGNTVVWTPAASSFLSSYDIMRILEAAGLPPGVINLVPGDPAAVSDVLLDSPDLAGIHFTGSTQVFQGMWKRVGGNIGRYKTYPRLVGETGGKDFIVAHPSADVQELATAIARGGFEYQGQKCSAASRVYVPRSLWNDVRERVVVMMREMRMGDVCDFRTFVGAVIDEKAFARIAGYLDDARHNATILQGGVANDEHGYFIEPTLVETADPQYRLMREEIFGPVVTAFVYPDGEWEKTLRLVDSTSPYALTGAVFGRDRAAIEHAAATLRDAAGNFYINDKPTGAVVGQQPFGGARGSGTNDKAGSKINLLRWVSARTIKETFSPPRDFKYDYMTEE
jgi:1-pyrroline-5-carboxylate dehydrogenase